MKFLHSMIRVSDPDATVAFFQLLGLEERRRMDNEAGRFTLIFLGVPGDEGGEEEGVDDSERPEEGVFHCGDLGLGNTLCRAVLRTAVKREL